MHMSFCSVERREEMKSWIVAAAGYFAMCTHNLAIEKYFCIDSSSRNLDFKSPRSMPLIQHFDGKKCPFHPLIWCNKEISTNWEKSSDHASKIQEISICGFDDESVSAFDSCDDSSAHSSLYFSSEPSRSENCFKEIENGVRHFEVDNTYEELSYEPSMVRLGSFRASMIKKISIRTNNTLFARPVSFSKSCLMSQIHKEWDKMNECALSPLPSSSAPTSSIWPFYICDENQILSQPTEIVCNTWIATDQNKQPMEVSGHSKLQRGVKLKTRRIVKCGKLSIPSKMNNGRYCHHFHGDSKQLLSLGFSIGIIYSLIATKSEVEKLRELLKESQNLVQDLQEEIEMNDAISVKELINAGNSFPNIEVNALRPEHDLKAIAKYDCEEAFEQKIDRSPKCRSTIEAELEAELERLELSIDNKRVPDPVQSDPELIANAFRGDLRGDNDAGSDSCGCSTTYTTGSSNYAVSPRDLSLRLHEVIQSRLEERVRELEAALQNTHAKANAKDQDSKEQYSWTTESPGSSSPTEIPALHGNQFFVLNSSEEESLGQKSEGVKVEKRDELEECEANDLGIWSDDDGGGAEMQKLVKQIAEKIKNSPALLNVQRALLSTNEQT